MPNATITRRAPSRSISAPPWMARSSGSTARDEMARPISSGDAPSETTHNGMITVTTLVEVLPKVPVA